MATPKLPKGRALSQRPGFVRSIWDDELRQGVPSSDPAPLKRVHAGPWLGPELFQLLVPGRTPQRVSKLATPKWPVSSSFPEPTQKWGPQFRDTPTSLMEQLASCVPRLLLRGVSLLPLGPVFD